MTCKESLSDTTAITDYLRLVQIGELNFSEICSYIQVDQLRMRRLLEDLRYKDFIVNTAKQLHMTLNDIWHRVDLYISQGFTDDEIACFVNLPLAQIEFRRRFLLKHLI